MNSRFIFYLAITFLEARNKISLVVRFFLTKELIVPCFLMLYFNSPRIEAYENDMAKVMYEFNIPAQPLSISLNKISDISEISALFPYDLVANKTGSPVKGRYSVQQALSILLFNSGLEGDFSDKKAFIIKPLSVSSDDDQSTKAKKSFFASLFSLMFPAKPSNEDSTTEQVEDSTIEVIQVYGPLRQSFEGAVTIKRAAETVVDAITAEDIGQFSDDSIAGAIQRIPGVQIETDDAGTDGDRVSIRGLGPEFVNSTINGRLLLSAGSQAKSLRKMNFNVFPPGVLASVEVAKGQTAVRPESGLAGQVNLSTLRPLEIKESEQKKWFSQLSIRGTYNDINDDNGFRASVLTALRNNNNSLGGYISLVASEEKNARDQLRINYQEKSLKVTDSDVPIEGVLVPTAITMNPIRETTERIAFATGIQYQPSDDLDINWDFMYSNYNNESHRDQNQFTLSHKNSWEQAEFDMSDASNPALVIDENNTLRYADFGLATGGSPIQSRLTSVLFNNKTENLITGLNIDWLITDELSANFDAYLSTVDYSQDLRFPRVAKELDNSTFIYDARGNIPSIISPDAKEAVGYDYLQTNIREIAQQGDNYGFTLKLSHYFSLDSPFFSLDFGLHYDETDITVKRTHRNSAPLTEFGDEILAVAFTGKMTEEDFLAGEDFPQSRWLTLDYDAATEVDPRINSYSWDELGIDPLASYDMTESTLALFAQVNLDTELFSLPLTGNIGMRAVLTDNESSAKIQLKINKISELTPVTASNDYWEYLPSINLNLALTDEISLRFGASRTLSRPDYQTLAPITLIEPAKSTATTGNPFLKPMTSNNLDITVEWYSRYDGAFAVSGFYKAVSDFIIPEEYTGTLPGYEGEFDINTFTNKSDGTAQGFEISFYQPFDKIIPALAGFGLSTNYTYVDTSFDNSSAVGDAGFGFPGASKNNINFITFYDADLFSLRLAYIYRSDFFRELSGNASQTDSAVFTDTQQKLDVSVTVRPMDKLTVKLNGSNLTNESRRDFIGQQSTLLNYFDRGRVYALSVTYNF